MIINENELLEKLKSANKILLLEPKYPTKYPPFALAKIKTYLDSIGNKYIKFSDHILPEKFDLICITTLFTYYSTEVFQAIKNKGFFNTNTPIIVGGVFATLMPNEFNKFTNLSVFKGYSKVLDSQKPDISIMKTIKDEKFDHFSWVFTTRGCPNKCLAGDTIVNTVEGDIPIKDLVGRNKIGVYTYSQETKEVFISDAINIREMGIKELLRIHFDDGTHIDCTPDHKILTWKNGNQYVPVKEKEKEAKDLKPGDRLRAFKAYKLGRKLKKGEYCGKKPRIDGENHKVVKITKLQHKQMTYDLEVPETHWFFANNVLVHNCAYCSVWRMEPDHWINPNWKQYIMNNTKILSLLDNNISAVDINHIEDIIKTVNERKLKILVESGVDCKYVTKDLANLLAKAKYARHGMRTAFDRIEEDGTFQRAVEILQKSGINPESMMAYVLFNFQDRPQDANYRTEECYKLKVRAYPQCFRPLNTLNKKKNFVGKHWTLRLTKAFRTFWIIKGIKHGCKDISFGEYIKTKEGIKKFKLTDSDISVWESNGKKE